MERKLKVNQIVPLGFGVIITIAGITTGVNQWTQIKVAEAQDSVDHTFEVKLDLKSIEKALVDAETGQRGFIFTREERYLADYNTGREDFTPLIERVKELVNDNPKQVERANNVQANAEKKFAELAETITLTKAGKFEETRQLVLSDLGKNIMDEMRAEMQAMVDEEDTLLQERIKASERLQLITNLINWGGWVVNLGVGIYISFVVSRLIMKPIDDAANAVAVGANAISTTVEQQARTINEQATSVAQTTTTMDELGSASLKAAEQAEESAEGARNAQQLAENGTLVVQQTMQGMKILKDNVGAIAEQIMRLSEQTGQISSISDLVGDIANQTNMLALNAAVEAARAGEQGKGFTVVASEIRKLADESKKSAEKISLLANDVQAAMNSTVMVTDEGTKKANESIELAQGTAETFTGVKNSIERVFVNSQQISLSAKQQAVAVQQVISAMNELTIGTQETTAGINQVKVTTDKLSNDAKELQAIV